MGRPAPLRDDERAELLVTHPGWTLDPDSGALRRTYTFGDFSEAFAFMTRVAMLAEQLDHHPDWSNVYDRVEIAVLTHDVGTLTSLDADFVAAVDRLDNS